MTVNDLKATDRVYYWDNLKVILIFLVVLGHFILPIRNRYDEVSIHAIYYWIYIFHMPAFIFVTGALASRSQTSKTNVNRLIGLIVLYLLFKVLIWGVESVVNGKMAGFSFFSDGAAPWFLISMFWCYLFIPIFSKLDFSAGMILTVVISLLVGLDGNANSFLAITKTINFAPFFFLGFKASDIVESYMNTKRKWMVPTGAVLLTASVVMIYYNINIVKRYSGYYYGDKTYEQIQVGVLQGMGYKLLWYLAAAVIAIGIILISSSEKRFYTYIGSRTLSVYIIHRLLRPITQKLLDSAGLDVFSNAEVAIAVYVLISILLVWLLAWKPLSDFFNKFLRCDYKWITRVTK